MTPASGPTPSETRQEEWHVQDAAITQARQAVLDLVTPRPGVTLPGLLRELADRTPDSAFAIFPDDDAFTLSYADTLRGAVAIARAVIDAGVSSGGRVALYLPSTPAYVWAWFGIMLAGRVDVNINPDQRGSGLAYVLNKSQAEVVITSPEGLARLTAVESLERAPALFVIADPQAGDRAPRLQILDWDLNVLAEQTHDGAATSMDGADFPVVDPFELASIRFTSGSTGLPKGVMLSQSHMLASARMFCHLTGYRDGEVLYTCFPVYHVHGSVTGILSALVVGGAVVMTRKFSVSRYWLHIRDYGAAVAHVLEAPANMLMSRPPSELDRTHGCRVLYAMTENEAFEARFGVNGVSLFDMTELTVVSYFPPGVAHRKGSQGLPSPLFDLAIVDEQDYPVPVRVEGEIVVRPKVPHIMMLGYFRDEALTLQRWRNLWFHTGDRGYLDEEGFLYFVGRMGDRIRRRGVNVSAAEVEAAAAANPAVAEAAVIGVPSSVGEDDIKICVTVKDGATLTPADLLAQLRTELTHDVVPRYIEIRPDFPRTEGTEKIRKVALRAEGRSGVTTTSWDAETGDYVSDLAAVIPSPSPADTPAAEKGPTL